MDSGKGQLFVKSDLKDSGKLLISSSAIRKENTEVQIEIY